MEAFHCKKVTVGDQKAEVGERGRPSEEGTKERTKGQNFKLASS